MFLVGDDKASIDYDLGLLRERTTSLDGRLDALEQAIQRCPDPDAFGLSDSAEAVCGLGFAACQQYRTATASGMGVEKSKALPLGPVHASGDTVVSIVNCAANYWKHGDEWVLGKSEKQQRKTQDGLEALLVDFEDGYPLPVILAWLVAPSEPWRLRFLLPLLAEWRDDVHAKFRSR